MGGRERGRVEEKKGTDVACFYRGDVGANIAVINVVPAQDHNNLAQI